MPIFNFGTNEVLDKKTGEVVQPKKRGRKPKISIDRLLDADVAPVPVTEPKKRGRKPKPKADISVSLDEPITEAEPVVEVPKKKRGRKPKVKEAEVVEDEPFTEVEADVEDEPVVEVPNKRGRGRAKKEPLDGNVALVQRLQTSLFD